MAKGSWIVVSTSISSQLFPFSFLVWGNRTIRNSITFFTSFAELSLMKERGCHGASYWAGAGGRSRRELTWLDVSRERQNFCVIYRLIYSNASPTLKYKVRTDCLSSILIGWISLISWGIEGSGKSQTIKYTLFGSLFILFDRNSWLLLNY